MTDFLVDENGDLQIANGDFIIGEADAQEIEHLMLFFKGEIKEHPTTGAGLVQMLKKRAGQTAAMQEARKQLTDDGFDVSEIKINGLDIDIDAERI